MTIIRNVSFLLSHYFYACYNMYTMMYASYQHITLLQTIRNISTLQFLNTCILCYNVSKLSVSHAILTCGIQLQNGVPRITPVCT